MAKKCSNCGGTGFVTLSNGKTEVRLHCGKCNPATPNKYDSSPHLHIKQKGDRPK